MSSNPADDIHPPSSSQFLPPQSAQPYRSIFGGPSSDAAPLPSSQPEPLRRSIFGGPSSNHVGPKLEPMNEGPEYDEFDALLRERPLEDDYNSEGESFQGSLDGDDGLGLESEPDWSRKSQSRTVSDSPRRSSPLQPTTYVLDRGLDLPPGVTRPNRWDGASSTYKKLIAGERGAYEGILASRSMDLAAHLYDSFVLRNQKADEQLGPDDESEDPAAVKKVWAGWPMLAETVPRSDEYVHRELGDPDTYRMEPDPRPSADLEESIMASMLKSAKENFLARGWDSDDPRPRSQEELDPKMDTEDEDLKQDDSGFGGADDEPFHPVFQADDDKSRRQLRPLSRNVITQIDRVLMGLHHAMQGRSRARGTGDEPQSDTEGETSPTNSRSGSRGRKLYTSDGDTFKQDPSQSRGRKQKSDPYIFQRGEQRDWSEVMGIAAMTGLPSDAVMRASKRCADLFGQDMEFRRLHEGKMRKIEDLGSGKWRLAYIESDTEGENMPRPLPRRKKQRLRKEDPVHDSDLDHVQPMSRPMGKGEHRKADILCPITSCPRHTQGFSRTWNLTLHMRKAHGREREIEGGAERRNDSNKRPEVIEID